MKTIITRAANLVVIGLMAMWMSACQDPIPEDYTEEVVVQGFVIGGKPITDVRVYRTLPIKDTFSYSKAVISDAVVVVKANGTDIPMHFVADSLGGFYEAIDTSYRAQYSTTYTIEVTARGKVVTGSTMVPKAFAYTQPPRDTIRYPGQANETKRFDSLDIMWEAVENVEYYIPALTCLDTANYGIYLQQPTTDTNTRLREEDFLNDGTLISNERTRYGFSLTPSTPIVWIAFKWFGRHTLTVYAGDRAFSDWFRMVGSGRRSSFDYRLSNVKGGLGVWAGASSVTAPVFLLKQ